jgi:hypothetical protein
VTKSVIGALNKHLIKENKENERPAKHIHPSSFGGCLRKTAYSVYGVGKPDKEVRILRIFGNGHYVHERIQGDCEAAGDIEVIGIEVPVFSEEYQIKGYVDGIIGLENEYYILEIKSKNNKGFTRYLKNPDKNHIVQANIYMWLVEEAMEKLQNKKEDLDEVEKSLLTMPNPPDKAIILYENKDTQDQKEFILDRDEKVVDWVKKRAKKFWEIVDSKKLPKRPYDIDEAVNDNKLPLECRYMCDYTRVCWSKLLDLDKIM